MLKDLVLGKSKHHIEDSMALRVLTSAMTILGIVAASGAADTPEWLTWTGITLTMVGSYVSYRRRYSSNFIGKIWISIGILFVAAAFFRELLIRINMSVADAREPLTNMLIALVGLHCFDLPRRRDLALSALVGLTLLASAATLSLQNHFVFYIVLYSILGAAMLHYDCVSRTLTRADRDAAGRTVIPSKESPLAASLKQTFTLSTFMCIGVAAVFLVMPRAELGLLKNIRISAGMNLSFLTGTLDWRNSKLGQLVSPDGSIKSNPGAYYGFAEELDTNYRGKLTDEIVLRVASQGGYYWRGMAYDTYDGIKWTMSQPKPVRTCATTDGICIHLEPLPGLAYGPTVPTKRINQVFYVEADASNLVVSAAAPSTIYFPSQNLQVDAYGAVRSPIGIEKDMVYTVFSEVPVFDPVALRRMPPPIPMPMPMPMPPGQDNQKIPYLKPNGYSLRVGQQRHYDEKLEPYLKLPELKGNVAELAANVAGEGSTYEQCTNIAAFLRSRFKYNLEIEPTPHGMDSTSDFLFVKKSGFCEHFATAFCVMARSRGIPSRLVTGYIPGTYNPLTGLWEVRLSDAHSWGEVFIDRVGWVAFDPTPDGPPGGFDGLQQRSASSWLADELGKGIENVSRWLASTPLKDLGPAIGEGLKELLVFAWTWGPWLIGVAAAAATGITLQRLLYLPKPRKVVLVSHVETGPREPSSATRSYMNVISALGEMGVTRHKQDTSQELLAKVRARLELKPDTCDAESVTSKLTLFLDSYNRARFGAGSEKDIEPDSLAIASLIQALAVTDAQPATGDPQDYQKQLSQSEAEPGKD